MATEEAIAGASFILSFYNDCESVLNAYATYLNVMCRIGDKYHMKDGKEKSPSDNNLEQEDEEAMLTCNETLRAWVARCYIKATSLENKLPDLKKEIGDLKVLYEKIITNSVIDKESVEKFVMQINKTFVSGVLKDLLIQSKDIYANLLK
jgi:hypothetical protein